MSNQEIKEALVRYKEIKARSTALSDMNSEQMIERMFEMKQITEKFPEWLESQQTLIDQQAQEIEKRKMIHEDYRRTALERIAYEVREKESAKSSLELAIKALEWYEKKENYEDEVTEQWEPVNPVIKDCGTVARTALDQIRRVET